MGSIAFGGDPESFMEAPRMENKGLFDSMGVSPVAAFLDLIGVHRQVAKGPKESKKKNEKVFEPEIKPAATVPSVLTDLESMFSPQETPITPVTGEAAMTEWGRRWLESNKPLMSFDPDTYGQ